MYEINLSSKGKKKFVQDAKAIMKEKGITLAELAKQINRPVGSLYCFFGNGKIKNRFLAAEIADALEMRKGEKS